MSTRRKKERADVSQRRRGVFLECLALSRVEMRVSDITEQGLGLELPPSKKAPKRGEVFHGRLNIGYFLIPVELKVTRIQSKWVGFEFVKPSTLVKNSLNMILRLELLAASLKLVSSSDQILKLEDAKSNQIEIHLAGKKVLKKGKNLKKVVFQMLGFHVEWSSLTEFSLVENGLHMPLPGLIRGQIFCLVQNVKGLDEDIQREFFELFQKIPSESSDETT